MSSLELQRIRLDQLEEYRGYGWRPVQEVDGAVGATPYSMGHGAEVLVMREMEVVLTKTSYGSITLTAEEYASAEEQPGQRVGLVEMMDAQHAEDQRQAEEMERWFAAVADHILEEVAKDRGAFRALAEIGLAIAAGELLRFAEERSNQKHSYGFLHRKGGTCDACTEAGIIARHGRALVLP